jgi:hypothetical protein
MVSEPLTILRLYSGKALADVDRLRALLRDGEA